MEESKASKQNDDEEEKEEFHDVFVEFPFSDCADTFDDADVSSPVTSLRRRRFLFGNSRDSAGLAIPSSSMRFDNHPKLKEIEINESVITNEIILRNDDSVGTVSNLNENEDSNSSILFSMMILMINFITFPVRVIYTSYMFVMNPFGLKSRVKRFVISKLMKIGGLLCANVLRFLLDKLKEQNSILKLGMKCGWGFLWCVYVCVVLVGLFVVAFVMGSLVIRGVVEEPIRLKEMLNFDYAEKSPVAYVPLMVCPGAGCDVAVVENVEVGKFSRARFIPSNHKLQVTVSLKVPESDYNRNLGVFQVRVDFLSVDGRMLGSSKRPCMLEFKSSIIRHLSAFLRVAPLLTGYISESQYLNINFRGFTEGSLPTTCLRVILEQRAEFRPGAGIPEIYTAYLSLESELRLLKRLIWYWKKTLYVWISIMIFIMELLFALLCCKPLVIPRMKLRENSNTGREHGHGRDSCDDHPVLDS